MSVPFRSVLFPFSRTIGHAEIAWWHLQKGPQRASALGFAGLQTLDLAVVASDMQDLTSRTAYNMRICEHNFLCMIEAKWNETEQNGVSVLI